MKVLMIILPVISFCFLTYAVPKLKNDILETRIDSLTLMVKNLNDINTRQHVSDSVGRIYSDILYRTNQQINLRNNPLAWFITAIGATISLLALLAAIALFLIGRDYRKAIQKYWENYKKEFDKINILNKQHIDKYNSLLDKRITELQDKIAKESSDQNNELKKQIDILKFEKEKSALFRDMDVLPFPTSGAPLNSGISANYSPTSDFGYSGYGGIQGITAIRGQDYHLCSECGKAGASFISQGPQGSGYYCPHCANFDKS
jgi:gas vesicle protein